MWPLREGGKGPTHFCYHRLQSILKNLTFKNGQIGSGQFTEGNKPGARGWGWGARGRIRNRLGRSVRHFQTFKLLWLLPTMLTKEPSTQIQRKFPAFSRGSSKSQIPHCLERMKWIFLCLSLNLKAYFSIVTPTPQKNKVSANPPGMIDNFRLKVKVNAMSHLWRNGFLINQSINRNDHQSSTEILVGNRCAAGSENLQGNIKIFDPQSDTFLSLIWLAVLTYSTRSKS